MKANGGWTRSGVIVCLLAAGACSASKPTEPTGSNQNGGASGGNTNNSDTVTVTVIMHGMTGTEDYENIAVAIAPGIIQRASATRSQLNFYENEKGVPGQDDTLQLLVPTGQTISLFAIENENYWDDVTTLYYNPTVSDTAVSSAALEFVSWSLPCGATSLGDCQLSDLQSNTQVTANFQRMKSLNVQAIGAGALARTIQTRPPLSIAPVIAANPINNTTETTQIFTDSAFAEQYEVGLFSGSQITLVGVEIPGSGFTVNFDGWGGGCSASAGATCIVKWPANPGGNFVYNGPAPVPPPQAKFQWYECTDNGTPQVAQGASLNGVPGWSCSLQSP
jgi:hypothetical protein